MGPLLRSAGTKLNPSNVEIFWGLFVHNDDREYFCEATSGASRMTLTAEDH